MAQKQARTSKKKKKQWSRFRKAFMYAAFAFILAAAGCVIYCLFLHHHIEERFSGRRWSIPSKVFSDTAMLYPGQTVNPSRLREKLRRLGYRETDQPPATPGDFRGFPGVWEIFLHDLKSPYQHRSGFPLRITFSSDEGIQSLERLDTHRQLNVVEIEPEEIMSFFGPEREQRDLVSLENVSAHLIDAVLAAEDFRFYHHHGLDLVGIARAAYVNLRPYAIRQGGSTIAQQLSKSYFLTPERTFSRKLKELLISIMLEAMYDKDEILEIYLNEIYLGQRGSVSINGVGEAARFYFGKSVHKLSLSEAAALAGLIKAPNYYSPYVDQERCRARRDQVLLAMQHRGLISAAMLATALQAPLETVGFAAYRTQAPYFVDYLETQLENLYPPEVLTGFGLSIYTTLDTQVQEAAESALQRGLERLERTYPALQREDPDRKLQGAIIVLQPKTGYIVAMVGGRDYRHSQFNRITQARRQPGSAFKPFVFLSALDSLTPVSLLDNTAQTYHLDGTTWCPQNIEPIPEKQVTLRRALAESINLATVDCAMRVGLDAVIAAARDFGLSTPLKPYPSLALGAFEVIPLELARAYCAFAADGVLPYPLSLREVTDEHGRALEQRHTTIKRVTSAAKAFIISSLLREAVETGTAKSLGGYGIAIPAAGKTGSTSNFRDAWFVGYTPDILALIWVGFDNGDPLHASGAKAALPIWADLIKAVPEQVSGRWFHKPPGVTTVRICMESRCRAVPHACAETRDEYFLAEHCPEESCPIHHPPNSFERILHSIQNVFK